MSHVVPGNLEASAEASHQAGVQSPETAEFDGCRYPEFLGRRFHVPVKKVMPVERLANLVGKDQVVRLTKLLVARPHRCTAARMTPCLSNGTSRLPASVFPSSSSSS